MNRQNDFGRKCTSSGLHDLHSLGPSDSPHHITKHFPTTFLHLQLHFDFNLTNFPLFFLLKFLPKILHFPSHFNPISQKGIKFDPFSHPGTSQNSILCGAYRPPMGFDDKKEVGEQSGSNNDDFESGTIGRQMSEASFCTTDHEDEDYEGKLVLGPQYTLKETFEKDKDDESLRKWKEQLLGAVDFNELGEALEPEVKILSLAIVSEDGPDIFLLIPEDGKPNGPWFTLKEGSRYKLRFTFQVNHNIVVGLKYNNTVWKTGIRVDSTKEMLGTFSPQSEPYTHEMPEETTPSGYFARGSYTARTKFLDDDNKCYLEINYTFDIRKDWLST